MQLHSLDQYNKAEREDARRHFGFATPLAVAGVLADGPAARADIRSDDALVSIGPLIVEALPTRPQSTDALVAAQLRIAELPPTDALKVVLVRNGERLERVIQPIPICKSRFELRIANDWRASADGVMVQISSRFLEAYSDDQIAALIAHELAHNLLNHRKRLAARGVAYGLLSGFGGNVKYYRQTEIEADLLSSYLVTNAGYSAVAAIRFWEHFGPSKAGGVLRSRSHPAWRDRVATLTAEFEKIARNPERPTRPSLIAVRDKPLDGAWERLLVRAR